MGNIGVKGRVLFLGTTDPICGLDVLAVDFDPINEEQILNPESKPEKTKEDGSFEIHYSASAYCQWYEGDGPDIVVRFYVPGGRLVYESEEQKDVRVSMLDIGIVWIHKNNIEGWLVTCATLDPKNGDPVWLTEGNKIESLIDGAKVFPELTSLAKTAKKSINLMNYKFGTGENVRTSYPDPFVQPKPGDKLTGELLQQILCERSNCIPVRVLVWDINAEGLAALILGVLTSGSVTLVALLLSASLIGVLIAIFVGAIIGAAVGFGITTGLGDTAVQVKEYFQKNCNVETRAFQSVWSIMHARVVVVDGETALVMGSSIFRGYFNDSKHAIHDARHGGSLIHDVHVKITGPAVEHLDRSFATIWNQSGPSGEEPLTPAMGQGKVTAPDVAAVQVLRTLPGNTFKEQHTRVDNAPPSVPKPIKGKNEISAGETAILEAYQRAIAKAEDFIYIENQYLTAPEIITALIHRMNEVTNLQLIMVLEVKPDHPDYRKKQIDYIKQLKAKISNPQRIQVYTLWSCAEAKPKMDIMPIKLHSKVAIIDDKWATVGTANLDAASMNGTDTITRADIDGGYVEELPKVKGFCLGKILFMLGMPIFGLLSESIIAISGHYVFRRPAQHANPNYSDHPSRFVDLNLVIYSDVAGKPRTDFISSLRKELWTEHLGLDPTDPTDALRLNPGAPGTGWATQLWKAQEEAKFKATQNQKQHSAKILAWQPKLEKDEYLKARGLEPKDFGIRKSADFFDLEKQEWKHLDFDEKYENKDIC